jgi:hypothetical protein
MTNLGLAVARRGAYRAAMLTCCVCEATSVGAAWHWIALLQPVAGGAETVCYCPTCAEDMFKYFSQQRMQRLAQTDEPDAGD